jgi:HEAT repeat protein
LAGLYFSEGANAGVTAALQSLTRRCEPTARASAAFAMGQIKDSACIPMLEGLLRDADQSVRSQALRALIRIRRRESGEAAAPAVSAPAEAVVAPPEAPAAETAKPDSVSS